MLPGVNLSGSLGLWKTKVAILMLKICNPLETVALLSGSNILDIDTNQSSRYCIKLNSVGGKEAYYLMNTSLTEAKYTSLSMKTSKRYKIISGENESTVNSDTLSLVLYEGEGVLIVEE